MGRDQGRSRTPARVQVLHFPKTAATAVDEPPRAALPDQGETSSGVAELPDFVPDDPFEDFGEGSPVEAEPARWSSAPPSRAGRRVFAPPPVPRGEPLGNPETAAHRLRESVRQARGEAPHAAPRAPRAPSPAVLPDSGQETLAYHRQKLMALAGKGGETGLADLALFAHTLFARGRVREAQVVFEGIVAREPEEAFAYTMLGAAYLAQGDEARALALFDAALALDPNDLAGLVNRAEVRLRRGQAGPALRDLERALAADPSGRDSFSERARALLILAKALARAER